MVESERLEASCVDVDAQIKATKQKIVEEKQNTKIYQIMLDRCKQ
jgi:hypothetical protein